MFDVLSSHTNVKRFNLAEAQRTQREEFGLKDCYMKEFTEQKIINAVKKLLTGKFNDYLRDFDFQIPFVEFGIFRGVNVIVPLITLTSSEQTEKERIVKQDTYSVTVTFPVLETVESEMFCFAYADAFNKALCDDVTLGGIADRAVITNKKYVQPKKADCGMDWEMVISLKVTIETMNN
jgi:hypothetical protein